MGQFDFFWPKHMYLTPGDDYYFNIISPFQMPELKWI
jgi:hypothetical protein